MKLIFLKDVGGVARAGVVKDVTDGYALNYLIPRGLATQATAEAVAAHAAKVKREGESRAKEEAALTKSVRALEGARFEMRVRATEKGGLFKSISAGDVLALIQKERGTRILEQSLEFPRHIKEIGEYPLKIKAAGASADITLAIAAA